MRQRGDVLTSAPSELQNDPRRTICIVVMALVTSLGAGPAMNRLLAGRMPVPADAGAAKAA